VALIFDFKKEDLNKPSFVLEYTPCEYPVLRRDTREGYKHTSVFPSKKGFIIGIPSKYVSYAQPS